ncbi:MAG: hypothetical protein QM820_48410 [Minicystis sp.]
MEIKTDVTLPFPRERVFVTYRDRLEELLQFLPNIRGMVIEQREERDGAVHLVNEWKGGGEIPSVARSFLSESMLAWTDHATWKAADFVCDWRTDVHAFPGALLSSGYNRFVEVPGGQTRIEFRGQLTCDASKVPGVPKLLARSLNGTIEKLFVGKIEENLVGVGRGIGKLLERDGK